MPLSYYVFPNRSAILLSLKRNRALNEGQPVYDVGEDNRSLRLWRSHDHPALARVEAEPFTARCRRPPPLGQPLYDKVDIGARSILRRSNLKALHHMHFIEKDTSHALLPRNKLLVAAKRCLRKAHFQSFVSQ